MLGLEKNNGELGLVWLVFDVRKRVTEKSFYSHGKFEEAEGVGEISSDYLYFGVAGVRVIRIEYMCF